MDINAPAAHIAQHKWQPNTPDDQGTPFLFQHGKATSNSSTKTLMRMLTKSTTSSSEQQDFPQALTFAASGIRSSDVVAITCDMEVITGKVHLTDQTSFVYCEDMNHLPVHSRIFNNIIKLGGWLHLEGCYFFHSFTHIEPNICGIDQILGFDSIL